MLSVCFMAMLNNLEIDSVSKRYGQRTVLGDIYMQCQTGDIIGLFGRNGCGKSTLLKIISGFEAADFKFVGMNGKKLTDLECAHHISYLSQDTFLPQNRSISDIIRLTLNKKDINDFADDPTLKPILKNKVNFLSGGELRYLEIKLLLCLPSKFILLDEPFNGLSPVLIESVISLILGYSSTKGIIITDHDYRNVLQVSNKYYLLNDGSLKPIYGKDDLIAGGYLNSGII